MNNFYCGSAVLVPACLQETRVRSEGIYLTRQAGSLKNRGVVGVSRFLTGQPSGLYQPTVLSLVSLKMKIVRLMADEFHSDALERLVVVSAMKSCLHSLDAGMYNHKPYGAPPMVGRATWGLSLLAVPERFP